MTLNDYLPIQIRRRWYHLLLAFAFPTLQAIIFGFGGALIISTVLNKFTNTNILKPIIFAAIFGWQFWRNGIPRFAHWFWNFELDDNAVRMTSFWGKQITLLRSEISNCEDSPPLIILSKPSISMKINWAVFPIRERLIVPYWLWRWVPTTALPIDIQEILTQRQIDGEDIEAFKNDAIRVMSSLRTIRGIRILSVVLGFVSICLGLYAIIDRSGLDSTLAGLLFILLGCGLTASMWISTVPATISIDEHGIQVLKNKKQQTWQWSKIEAIRIRIPTGRTREIKMWVDNGSYDLPVAYLDNFEQFAYYFRRQAYAREIPFYIWKE